MLLRFDYSLGGKFRYIICKYEISNVSFEIVMTVLLYANWKKLIFVCDPLKNIYGYDNSLLTYYSRAHNRIHVVQRS